MINKYFGVHYGYQCDSINLLIFFYVATVIYRLSKQTSGCPKYKQILKQVNKKEISSS
jgi:hypothetical protein